MMWCVKAWSIAVNSLGMSRVRRPIERQQSGSGVARRLAQLLAAVRYDLSWRFARPGAFRQRFEQAIANMPQGICLYDADDRLQLVNEQFCRIYNQPMHRLRTGMTLYDVLADSCAIGNYPGRSVEDIYSARKAFIDRRERGTFLQQLGDGRLIAIYHQPLNNGGWVCTYEDITERRKVEARIEFLAHHDGLTELPNRIFFADQLDRAIAQADADNPCSLLCLDLDGFKDVNDRLGHTAGDVLLKNVAMRLLECARANDTPARLGGDEFAVVLPATSPTEALRIANEMASMLRQPYFLGAFGSAEISASIGVACAPVQATTRDDLLLVADRALYVSKNARAGMPVLFDSELEVMSGRSEPREPSARKRSLPHEQPQPNSRLAEDLRNALRHDLLSLHYQPIYECASGRPVVVEALARWHDPVRGNVPPLEFVKAAEECGLIGQLTEWVLAGACHEASQWSRYLQVSINVSPLNLVDPSFVSTVRRALADADLPPSRLVLELTEGSMIDWSDDMAGRLLALRDIGVELWIDDFGAGYANFVYLQRLSCSVIKIDRSFLTRYEKRRELLGGMISLAQACGLRVVVEGVECNEHRDLLRELRCDLLQGFLLAKPLPADQMKASLGLELPFHESAPIAPTPGHADNAPSNCQ
jgi:diguanylate cyclase (GGDEF)-like protein